MHWKILTFTLALAGSLLAQTTPSTSTSTSTSTNATAKHPFTFEDMMKMKRVGAPVPSPDGKWVVFDAVDVDLDANTKLSHLWIVPAAGGEARRLNQTPNAEERPRFSPDGKRLIWTSEASQKNARDLTPGDHDVPPFNLGGQDMYAVSPDGQELAYTSNIDEVEATSTNNEIFLVPMAGGTPKKISTSPGNDNTPVYSPDGHHIVWRSMARARFEADKETLVIYQRQLGQSRKLAADWDRSVASFAWLPDSKTVILSAEDRGESPLYSLALDGSQPTELVRLHADDLAFGASTELFFTHMSIVAPNEIWCTDVAKKTQPIAITHMNDALLSQIDMQPLESFTFKGANNEEVQGFIIKPPGFDPAKKYPLKFLIHGGPQGAWGNDWTYRWNAGLFAVGNPESFRDQGGYVVVMINFHGSTGYGQKFTDSISGAWCGKPFVDLMKGLDYVEKTYPFVDKTREAALGASYGGYMANWLLGHTNRFKCIVSHDGTFNTESTYGTTEELWFAEWEFKGPPWQQRELYRKFSPHLFADKFKTPTLVVHGQLDYRLDVSEGFQLFTTLQRLKVPSKMLYFPDEGHWVLKPQNSRLWYKTVNDWVDQWCGR